jgi:multiple sugar transport system permease protein
MMVENTTGHGAQAETWTGKRRAWLTQKRVRHILGQALTHLVLIGLGAIFAVPFVWLVSTSLKPDAQIFKLPPEWIPRPVTWSNYTQAMDYVPFFKYMGNTFYIAIFNVVGMAVSCSLAAYGFARIPWPGRDLLFVVLVSTLMIPWPVTLIPQFLIFRRVGWVGTFKPLTWTALTGSAFYIFLLRQFYMTIPQALSDSARIDGASELGIFTRIILPLTKPALATVGLFTFMANWNDFLGPLVYLSNKDQYTLAIGIYGYFTAHSARWSLFMAASTVMIMPVIILFFFTQRTFIQGITLTGIKG